MVTEHTHVSWFQRITSSLTGIVFGLLLLVIALGVLWWNEGRAVKRAKGLTEGASAVVSISPDQVDPNNDGKLVHLSGQVIPGETIKDALTGRVFEGIGLSRDVEMYQWREDKETKSKKQTKIEDTHIIIRVAAAR